MSKDREKEVQTVVSSRSGEQFVQLTTTITQKFHQLKELSLIHLNRQSSIIISAGLVSLEHKLGGGLDIPIQLRGRGLVVVWISLTKGTIQIIFSASRRELVFSANRELHEPFH